MKPLIGIMAKRWPKDDVGLTTNLGTTHQTWLMLAEDYIQSVEEQGGIPIVIPICESGDNAIELLDSLDGIIFSGGNDVNPARYGETPQGAYPYMADAVDSLEMTLYEWARQQSQIPILGICRGLQMMNVVHGGTLFQDIYTGQYAKHMRRGLETPRNFIAHAVAVEKGTQLYRAIGSSEILTNSFHHQSIKRLGDGFKISAMSEDGVIEGIEALGDRFIVAVQWHPEMLAPKGASDDAASKALFRSFVEEASQYKMRKLSI